jgi:hypothetical protein
MLDGVSQKRSDARRLTIEMVRAMLPDEFFMKQGYVPCQVNDRRRFARLFYRVETDLRPLGNLPAFPREPAWSTVYLSDLSRSGAGFISPAEFYPGEQVELQFSALGTKCLVVKRCRKSPEGCFEIGCEFVVA